MRILISFLMAMPVYITLDFSIRNIPILLCVGGLQVLAGLDFKLQKK